MPEFVELTLEDGASIRLELAPTGEPMADGNTDLPEGFGGVDPVARGRAGELAVQSLRFALRPLGRLLQEVHDSVAGADDPPCELSVSFGLQIGQDLKLGVVNANGNASMNISATWQLPPRTTG
jgi:hypothetical protein